MQSFQNKEELKTVVEQWCLNKNISNLIQKYGHISEWDVSNVTDMSYIFCDSDFNGDISKWNVSNVTNMNDMFTDCPIDNIYKPIKKTFCDTFMIVNKIIEGDNECPIALELIDKNDKYLSCETCYKNFKDDIIELWLKENKNCPYCRSQWTNKIIYINN